MGGIGTVFRLFWSFFKIGFFTFGGGLAMIPFIEEEFVKKLRWVGKDEMTEMVILSQTLPGVVAVNVSILIGQRKAGLIGAIMAVLGTVLPALIAIVLILELLSGFEDNKYVKMVFVGIKASSAALILHTVWRLSRKTISTAKTLAIGVIALAIVMVGFSAAGR